MIESDYTDDLIEYKELINNYRILPICPCSNITIHTVIELKNKYTKSKLLRELVDDVELIKFKPYKNNDIEFEYLKTSKSLKLFEKDEWFNKALNNIDINNNIIMPLDEHLIRLGIEPDFDYVLMNYMDTIRYILHGSHFKYSIYTQWQKYNLI